MSRSQCTEFQEHPYHRQAVWLRYIDDQAKVPGRRVPGLDTYRELMEDASRPRQWREHPAGTRSGVMSVSYSLPSGEVIMV